MTPCNHWVNCSIFALLTRAMNMYLTFRRKVSRFWGIRTFTNTALSHTRVSLKPATLFNVEKDLGKKLVPVLLYALRKCTIVSRLFHAFVFHPTSCGRGKWLPKLLLLALLAVNWKLVMIPWTCGRRKMLNVSFC